MRPAALFNEASLQPTDPRSITVIPIALAMDQGSESSKDGNKLRCDTESNPTKIKSKAFKFYFDISYIMLDNP